MGMKSNGFKRLQEKLKSIGDKAEALQGEYALPITELLSDEFMRKHTRFSNLAEFLDEAGVPTDAVDVEALNRAAVSLTAFSSWEDMRVAAISDYSLKQLGL